jgi:hypothetical protein
MVLRNSIDSAHVDLAIFTSSQLRVLHSYTELAEAAFRKLLSKALVDAELGRYQAAQYEVAGCDQKTAKIIERIAASQLSSP